MQTSPMEALYRRHSLALEEYRGSLTLAAGGEGATIGSAWPAEQVLLYDASWRAGLAVAGPDARKWLNGMFTANFRDLAPGRTAPSFQLDPKGHILATLDALCLGETEFLLLTDEAQRAGLVERLRRFVFISKLTIEDRGEGASSLVLRGPQWRATWRRASLPELALENAACARLPIEEGGEALAFASVSGGIPQMEIVAPAAALPALWMRLQEVATAAGAACFERDRILSRVPRYGADLAAGELPQETGQWDRLDFTKGCYIGQEIVERIRARGAVHRHFTGFGLAAPVAVGTPIRIAEAEVGKITSVAARASDWFGLGYIRDPHQAPDTAVTAGGVPGWVEADEAQA